MNPSSNLVEAVLSARGLTGERGRAYLERDWDGLSHDPFLLPDMHAAVERIVRAKEQSEHVVIYGDYDIDGLTASTVLQESLAAFGIPAKVFIPNRFVEGYGLATEAIERLADQGAQLIITVDCGSLSHKEIARAGERGVDVIVTDHHNVAPTMPPAVAVINPKRLLDVHPEKYDNFVLKPGETGLYPFLDLPGVGVAFKLVQALQTRLDGLPNGHEKWLLDLVALGTVCDVVTLQDENRTNVYWGMQVMRRTKRPGIKLLMAVSRVEPEKLVARSLGFGLGPRLNAAGRMETAQLALELLTCNDSSVALELAERLDLMNTQRRTEQDRIFKAAKIEAEQRTADPVLIVSDASWSHGIIGIVAAKLLETYKKPTFVLQELEDGTAKGSARSYGEFSAADAIVATRDLLLKGGGHRLAAGVTLKTETIATWRKAVNQYYKSLKLVDQLRHLDTRSDVTLTDFSRCSEGNVSALTELEPYGNGNPEPVFEFADLVVLGRRLMGADNQHVKYKFADPKGQSMEMIAFNKASEFTVEAGEHAQVWCELGINEWNGRQSVEGRLLKLESLAE
ncbi:MAG TPA: single-stranded-DNA-specific exonuclease RecJ [Candidatus Saccharimonadales bacterium]